MKKLLIIILLFSLQFLVSCGDSEDDTVDVSPVASGDSCYTPGEVRCDGTKLIECMMVAVPDADIDGAYKWVSTSDCATQNVGCREYIESGAFAAECTGTVPANDNDIASVPDADTATPADSDITETPDADISELCGNGTIDSGERCDPKGAAANCSDIDSNTEGSASCKIDCSGYDTSTCTEKTETPDTDTDTNPAVTPLGTFDTINYSTTSIYTTVPEYGYFSATPYFKSIVTFMANGAQQTIYIPHNQTNAHETFCVNDSGIMTLMQNSYLVSFNGAGEIDSFDGTDANNIQFSIELSKITQNNTIHTCIVNCNTNLLIMNTPDVNTPTSQCVSMVAYGDITVTAATIAGEGNSNFAFTSSNMKLYHPTATPEGDVTSEIVSAGLKVCK